MIYIIIILGLFIFVLSFKYIEFFHWLYVYLLMDPGGYFGIYFTKDTAGGFYHMDIFFYLAFIPLLTGKYKIKDFFKDKIASRIFFILLIFSFYQIFVYGLIVPNSDINYFFRYYIIRERYVIFGFLIIIPIYLVALKNLSFFLDMVTIMGTLILILYFISLLVNINLVPSMSFERYSGEEDIIRHFLYSTGFLNFLIPASIILFFAKIKYKFKFILLVGGILSVINETLDLTKGELLRLMVYIVASFYLGAKLLNIKISKSIRNIVVFLVITITVMSFLFPQYIDFVFQGYKDIYTLVTIGKYEYEDRDESRLVTQVPAQLYMIKQRPIFGTGHSGVNLSPKFHISDYDVTDLPLLGHLMQYGFLGIFIYIFYYFKIFKVMKELYFAIKRKEKLEIVQKYRFEFIFSICSIVFFTAYFIRIYGCFIELSNYWDKIETTIYVAILLACLQKFKRDKILNNQQESYSRKEDMILENVKSNNNLHPEG